MQLQISDYIIIIVVIIALIMAGLYYFNRKNYKKVIESQDFIAANKMTVQIFVIDKKYERPTDNNLPKNIYTKNFLGLLN